MKGYDAMLRREARKLDVEIARLRPNRRRQFLPLDFVLYDNRWKARPGLRKWRVNYCNKVGR